MENVGVGAEPASLIRTLVKNRTVSSIRLLVSRLWDASRHGRLRRWIGCHPRISESLMRIMWAVKI